MHLFCLHHAGGTAASFSAWRFPGVDVTKLGYRGREFNSVAEAADQVAQSVAKSPAPRLALYGHSMGALLAYEAALRLEHTGRVAHVFLAASGPPLSTSVGISNIVALAGSLSERAREVLLEDLALLPSYQGVNPGRQLRTPVTIIYSSDDPVVPVSEALRWSSWCATEPRLVDVSSGGHLFHRSNPQVLRVVAAALS